MACEITCIRSGLVGIVDFSHERGRDKSTLALGGDPTFYLTPLACWKIGGEEGWLRVHPDIEVGRAFVLWSEGWQVP